MDKSILTPQTSIPALSFQHNSITPTNDYISSLINFSNSPTYCKSLCKFLGKLAHISGLYPSLLPSCTTLFINLNWDKSSSSWRLDSASCSAIKSIKSVLCQPIPFGHLSNDTSVPIEVIVDGGNDVWSMLLHQKSTFIGSISRKYALATIAYTALTLTVTILKKTFHPTPSNKGILTGSHGNHPLISILISPVLQLR
jgi:hypothetical protein